MKDEKKMFGRYQPKENHYAEEDNDDNTAMFFCEDCFLKGRILTEKLDFISKEIDGRGELVCGSCGFSYSHDKGKYTTLQEDIIAAAKK